MSPFRWLTSSVIPLAMMLVALPMAAHAAAPSFVHGGQVTMCVDPTYPPMEMYIHPGDKAPVGFDIDLGAALAKAWGAKLTVQTLEFTGLLPGLGGGRCDFVISGMFVSPARTKVFDAVPYLRSSMVLMVRAGNNSVHGPDDLAGKVLAVQSGTIYEQRARTLAKKLAAAGKPPLTIQAYPKGTAVAEQLLTGRAQAGISQDTEAAYRAVVQPGKFKIAYAYPPTDSFGIYFRKNPADMALIASDVARLREDGVIRQLAAKWHLPAADATAPLN
ncbi:MAG: transporter substrate-binding domain-containing protein [Acetobacteraceae bacterium]